MFLWGLNVEKKKPHLTLCVWLTAVSSYGRVGFINVNSSLSTGHIQSPVGQNVHQSLQWLTDGQTIVCFHSLPPSCDGFYKLMFLFIVEDLDLLTSVIARGEGGGDSWSTCIQDLLVNVPSLALSHSYIQSMIVCDEMFVTFSSLFHSGLDLKKYFWHPHPHLAHQPSPLHRWVISCWQAEGNYPGVSAERNATALHSTCLFQSSLKPPTEMRAESQTVSLYLADPRCTRSSPLIHSTLYLKAFTLSNHYCDVLLYCVLLLLRCSISVYNPRCLSFCCDYFFF